jgi:hypothetical protein
MRPVLVFTRLDNHQFKHGLTSMVTSYWVFRNSATWSEVVEVSLKGAVAFGPLLCVIGKKRKDGEAEVLLNMLERVGGLHWIIDQLFLALLS